MIPQDHTPWRAMLGLEGSDPDSPGFGGKLVSPPSPLVALYLDAAAQSWDLTFLLLRRPGDPRQGALRASAQRGPEDGCYRQLLLGEWVGVPGSQQNQAALAVISWQRQRVEGAGLLTTESFLSC